MFLQLAQRMHLSVKIKLSKKAEGKVLVLPRHILFFHPFQSIKDMYSFKSKSKLDKKYLFWQSSTSNFPKQVLVEFLSNLDEIFPLYKIGVSLKDDVMVITLQSVFIKNEQIGTKDLLDFVEQTICAVKDMQEDVCYLEIWPQVKIRKNIAYIISDICILLFFLFFVFVILVSWFSF